MKHLKDSQLLSIVSSWLQKHAVRLMAYNEYRRRHGHTNVLQMSLTEQARHIPTGGA